MKKRLFGLILSIAAVLCGIFAFSACDENEKEPATEQPATEQPAAEENGLSFQTLTVDGTNVYGKVSNATETFSFLNEVTARGNSKFVVTLDIYGTQSVLTKTIPLAAGDNTAYIMEMLDGEMVKMYTVTVRRRPMYTVSFDTIGGTAVQSQQVEEDSLATAPESVPERQGYTFEEWNYDFSQAVTQNTTIAASWKPNTNTAYKVEYYLQNLENEYNYTLRLSENLTGTTGATVNAEIKTFEHFTHTENPHYGGARECGVIAGNGSLVLKVYYTRNSYTITFNGNGGTIQSYDSYKTYTVKYGAKVTAPECMRVGYTFTGWDKQVPETISENITLSAAWQINQYTLTLVFGGGFENKTITQDYGSAIENIEIPDRAGYDFGGWQKNSWSETILLPETMPADNHTYYVRWNAIFTLNESGDTITGLTYYGKSKTELIIPSEIDGIKLTSIGDSAFEDCTSFTSVTIPNSIASIGDSAFRGCSSFADIYYMGDIAAWCNISGLVSLMYYGASNKNLYIGGSLIMGDLIIPNSVTSIGYSAFYGCTSLTSVTIPDSVTSIGWVAFRDCSSLTSVTIGNSVTSIGDFAFSSCAALERITIPDGVASIGRYAFSSCTSLISITIPDSVTSIGDYAFYGCSKLTYNEGNGLKHLGNPDNPYLYLAEASQDIRTAQINNRCRFIGDSAFSGCVALENITIPDSVTSIGDLAFYYCSSLTSVTIGNSVTSIGFSAFYGCDNLAYNEESGLKYLGNPDNPYLYLVDASQDIKTAKISNRCKLIGHAPLSGCSSLTGVTIGNSVTFIDDYAFTGCESLACIMISNSVTSIGDWAFLDCNSLQKVYYKGSAEEWRKISIDYYNDNLTAVKRYYYSESTPTENGNFWHYGENGEIVEW